MERWWILGTALLLASCGGEEVLDASVPDANDGYTEIARVPITVNRDLDVLFVIDDSPTGNQLQTNLHNSFANFINVLNGIEGGLPNLHLGVVTSDLGMSGAADATPGPGIGSGPGSCASDGKGGRLQTNSTTLVQGNFIADTKNTDGTRNKNYTGTLEGAFNAISSVGSDGCGFEQPIEAAKRALANNPANTSFRRPSAHLALVFLTDEDDCSLAHWTLLSSDSSLGPLQSFRCTRYGITCTTGGATTDEMNMLGAKAGCSSNEASAYLTPVGGYTSFFSSLVSPTAGLFVGTIAGPPTPFSVELRPPPGSTSNIPALAHSCESTSPILGDPAVRLEQFAATFSQHTTQTVCNPDLSDPTIAVAKGIRLLIGTACISEPLAMPYDCKASKTSGGMTTALPACDGSTARPCWEIVSDPLNCQTGSHLTLKIQRAEAPSPDEVVTLRCRL